MAVRQEQGRRCGGEVGQMLLQPNAMSGHVDRHIGEIANLDSTAMLHDMFSAWQSSNLEIEANC